MKRFFIFIFIIFSAVLVYSDEYYRSNILGMKLEKIDNPPETGDEWVLGVSYENGIEKRILYNGPEIISEKEIKQSDGRIIETTLSGEKTEIITRDGGVIISEETHEEGVLPEKDVFIYKNRRLQYTEHYSGDEKIYTDKYNYTNDGRLLDVKREYNGKADSVLVSFMFNDGRIESSLYNSGKRNNFIIFDENGIVLSESYGDTANETREYGELENGLRFEKISNMDNGDITMLIFDEKSRIISNEVRSEKGVLKEKTEWFYESDRISKIKNRKELLLETVDFSYGDDGELVEESYTRNGNIMQIRKFDSELDYTEELYRNGLPVLLITYKDGTRIKTEQIREY